MTVFVIPAAAKRSAGIGDLFILLFAGPGQPLRGFRDDMAWANYRYFLNGARICRAMMSFCTSDAPS